MDFVLDIGQPKIPKGVIIYCRESLLFDRVYERGEQIPYEDLGIPWEQIEQLVRVRKAISAQDPDIGQYVKLKCGNGEEKKKYKLQHTQNGWNVLYYDKILNPIPYLTEKKAKQAIKKLLQKEEK